MLVLEDELEGIAYSLLRNDRDVIQAEIDLEKRQKQEHYEFVQAVFPGWEAKKCLECTALNYGLWGEALTTRFNTIEEWREYIDALAWWAWNDCCNGVGDGTIHPGWYFPAIVDKNA